MPVQEKELIRADIENAYSFIRGVLLELQTALMAIVPAQATVADYADLSGLMRDIRGGCEQLQRTLWIPHEDSPDRNRKDE